jgi:hypothetical protein
MRWLGIDFSGSDAKWRPRCRTSNVWIAEVVSASEGLKLSDLRRVQELPGEEEPFQRLAAILRAGDYAAAAIDAPFSVPSEFVPAGKHRALLELIAGLPKTDGRAFPRGGRPSPRAPANAWERARRQRVPFD